MLIIIISHRRFLTGAAAKSVLLTHLPGLHKYDIARRLS